ncbi:hypothetical protein PG993_008262 [Apiospora rasikravindrae]|uniref:Clr5 domain-containing protein n=1 Tax=Apiospora rasikravindrae TaxID=990691 RepID=A0ABR1SZU8_9PEZI
MSTPTIFKWVGPKQQRATKIPAVEWAKHEARLRELHSKMTLFELMGVMESEGFIATQKQYVYQFSKWGLHKYDTIKRDSEAVSNQLPTVPEEDRNDVSDPGSKRPRSFPSIELCPSGLPSSVPSYRKRAKVNDEEGEVSVLRCPTLDSTALLPVSHSNLLTGDVRFCNFEGGNGDEDKAFRSYSPTPDSHSSSEFTNVQARYPTTNSVSLRTDAISDDKWPEFIESFIADEVYKPYLSVSSSSEKHNEDAAPASERTFQLYLGKAAELADYAKKSISWGLTNRPMMMDPSPFYAADYLYAVLNKQRSFHIYAQLLEADPSTHHVLPEMVLACARAAKTPEQRKFVQALLTTRLNKAVGRIINPSERSLANLLRERMLDPNNRLGAAWTERRASTHSSFEILIYLYERNTHEPICEAGLDELAHQSVADHMASISHDDFVQSISACRHPPLSEQAPERYNYLSLAMSDCVRSCVNWCATQIDSPMLYESFDTDWLSQGTPWSRMCRWREFIAVYIHLYHKWRSSESDILMSPTHWGWKYKTREKLGISTAELLAVCCDMVTQDHSDSIPRERAVIVENDEDPYAYVEDNIRRLQHLTNNEIVTMFLRHLYLRTTDFPQANEYADIRELLRPPIENEPDISLSAGQVSETETPAEVESEMIPTQVETFDPPRSTVPRHFTDSSSSAYSVKDVGYDPTIASSCRSSSSSYRRMKDAAASFLKSRFSNTGSHFSLSSGERAISLAESIENMSDTMRDSFRISGAPEQEHTPDG